MTLREIIEKYLKDNSYDGLLHGEYECGCGLDDLFPCIGGDEILGCQPAFKRVSDDPEDGGWAFFLTKKEEKNEP